MPKSSVSDFEHFAGKVEEHIAAKVKKSKEDSSAYRLQQEKKSIQETEKYFNRKRTEWKLELDVREQQERRAIADEVDKRWSLFKKESKSALKETVQKRLKEQFPTLAKCFILWVSKEYKTGIFMIPEAYSGFVDKKRFDLEVWQREKIVFKQNNLYIEYSVERIMEEFKGEMTAMMHVKEDQWQV